jgi:hypothetical protein
MTSERLDEKRSMAIQQTAHALANTQHSGISSTVVPGLTMNKLDAWQSDFDAVSPDHTHLITPPNTKYIRSSLHLSTYRDPRYPQQSPTLKLSQLVLTNADPKQSLISRSRVIEDQPVFNLELKGVVPKDGSGSKKGVYPGPVTNQKQSGRCWLFATSTYWLSSSSFLAAWRYRFPMCRGKYDG